MTQQTGQGKALAKSGGAGAVANATPLATFKDLLAKAGPSISSLLPKHLSTERLMKVALASVSRQPELLECTPLSIIQGVLISAQLGLEIGGPLQQAHLVAYRNKKTGHREAQFIPGYRGLIELARRGGEVVSVEARNVYAGDLFEVEFTIEGTRLRHVPAIDGERGRLRCVYALARLKDPSAPPIFDLLTEADVKKARASSQAAAAGFGPWVDNEEEMWRKTAVKRLSKYLPLSVELSSAIELENRAENEAPDISGLGFDVAEIVSETPAPPAPTKGAAGLKAAVAKAPAPAPAPAPAAQQAAPAENAAPAPEETVTEEDIDRASVVAQIREKLAKLSEGKTNGPSYRNSLVSAWSEGWIETQEALDEAEPNLLALTLRNALES